MMQKKSKLKWDARKILSIFLIVLGIILVFTLVDYLAHLSKGEYSVPSYYFRNKIIFGTIIGFIAYFFIARQKLVVRSLIFSAAVSILLQIRYYLEGYPLDFVVLFLFIHFAILLAASLLFFHLFRKYLNAL